MSRGGEELPLLITAPHQLKIFCQNLALYSNPDLAKAFPEFLSGTFTWARDVAGTGVAYML